MDEVDDVSTSRSYNNPSKRSDDVYDVSSRKLTSRTLNNDVPKPSVRPTGTLKEILESIDKQTTTRKRLPLSRSDAIPSFRIAGDNYPSGRSTKSQRTERSTKSLREEKSNIQFNREFLNKNPSLLRYLIREKFKVLLAKNPNVEIPDFSDPKDMIEAYNEAIRTNHFTSTSATWMMYMGIGYAVIQGLLKWVGFKNIDRYAETLMQIMKHYPTLLKELGDPGGLSAGSSWPPWLKLTVVMAIHTVIFLIMVKITGDDAGAKAISHIMCGTGFMGGKSAPTEETEIAGDSAMSGLGGILGNLGGLFGGGGGGGNFLLNIMGGLMGGGQSAPNIDLDNIPDPKSDRSVSEASSLSSARKTMFDD